MSDRGRDLSRVQADRLRPLVRAWLAADPSRTQTSLARAVVERTKARYSPSNLSRFVATDSRSGLSYAVALAIMAEIDVEPKSVLGEDSPFVVDSVAPRDAKHAATMSAEYRAADEDAREEFDRISFKDNRGKDVAWWTNALRLCVASSARRKARAAMGLPPEEHPFPGAMPMTDEDE